MNDSLDSTLRALRREIASLEPPPAVGRALAAAIARAERRAVAPGLVSWRAARGYWLAGSLTAAAALVFFAWTLRVPPAEPQGDRSTAFVPAATDFIPVVPVGEIASTRAAYVVSTLMPRTMLADFGLPVSPTRAAEPVASELLVRGDGTVLAVRFLE